MFTPEEKQLLDRNIIRLIERQKEASTYTEHFSELLKAHKEGTWQERDVKRCLNIALKVDPIIKSLGIEVTRMLSGRSIIRLYNIQTQFKEFENLDTITAMVGGYGSMSGGSEHPYRVIEKMHCIAQKYASGGWTGDWTAFDDFIFSNRFCTAEQWKFIESV
jgi:hypothetical protein